MRGTGYRVLLIAEAANPEWVSVPLVGWSIFAAIRDEIAADGGEAHLVPQARNRDALQRAGLREGEDFTSIDTEVIARPVYRLSQLLRMGEGRGWTMVHAVNALAYPWCERKVWALFGPQIEVGHFDIVHRVTPLSPTIPSPISRRCRAAGMPFVRGPLNGGVPWPKGFDQARWREREWLSYFRGLNHLRPSVRRSSGRGGCGSISSVMGPCGRIWNGRCGTLTCHPWNRPEWSACGGGCLSRLAGAGQC